MNAVSEAKVEDHVKYSIDGGWVLVHICWRVGRVLMITRAGATV